MSVILALIGVVVGVAAVYFAVAPQRSIRRLGSVERFRRARRHLKRELGSLFERSLAEQQAFCFHSDLPVLTREGWIPSRPLPLESVLLHLRTDSGNDGLAAARSRVRGHLPRRDDGHRVGIYSEATGLYDRPQVWFDMCAYRLLEVLPREPGAEAVEGAIRLTFGLVRQPHFGS
jgi:hypothetical protein